MATTLQAARAAFDASRLRRRSGGSEAAPASGVGVRKVGVADDDENTKQQVSWLVGREGGKEAQVLRSCQTELVSKDPRPLLLGQS